MSGTIPIVLNGTGQVPATPATLRANLLALVTTMAPGYTADLPGTLIEDILSTSVGALLTQDSALCDLIQSVTPYGINEFLLTQLGNVYGVPQGVATNTSAYVVFTGTPGYAIQPGFTVSDGTYQYTVQDGVIVPSGGVTAPVYVLAVLTGTWPVPSGTITTIVTSLPSGIVLTATNPSNGTPGLSTAEPYSNFRARVLTAGLASAQGMPRYLMTALGTVTGVQSRTISVVSPNPSQWKVMVAGGDPYSVAFAVYESLFDFSQLVGATTLGETIVTSVYDAPDTYPITIVVPNEQTVSIALVWTTSAPNFVSPAAVSAAANPAIVAYVNALVTAAPINLLALDQTFQTAMTGIVLPSQISNLVWTVTIGNTVTAPTAGTRLVYGDPESYFFTQTSNVLITQA